MYMLSSSTGIQVSKHSASCLCILTKLKITHTHMGGLQGEQARI